MQDLPSRPDFQTIAAKWHDLAQRRLDYYTELYRSGRWRRYYTQDRFAIRMLDVINAAKSWRDLAGQAHDLAMRLEHPPHDLEPYPEPYPEYQPGQPAPSERRNDGLRSAA